MFIYIFLMLFNKTIHMYYSLFVFRFYYKIIVYNLKILRAAGSPVFGPRVWAGPGPETCGPGRAGSGPNINKI